MLIKQEQYIALYMQFSIIVNNLNQKVHLSALLLVFNLVLFVFVLNRAT